MSYLGLDMFGYEIDDGLPYCAACDRCAEFNPVAMNNLYERWQCSNCGHLDNKLIISDYGYQLQGYLLQNSEYDEGLFLLYNGTYK